MDNKILSISIAAYNVSKYLDNAMKSLIQDESLLQRMEIIIVNDGSEDDTSEKAHGYAFRYPGSVIVVDKENGGYGSTINASLAIAKGKYYKLLDGDDWYSGDNLSGFLDFLDKASADLIVSPYYQVIGSNTTIIDTHQTISYETTDLSSVFPGNNTFLMHEITINTERIKAIQQSIAEKCFYTDSEYVFYAISSADTVVRFEKPIYCYRLGVEGQSVSLTGIRKHYRDFPVVAKRIFSFYEQEKSRVTGSKKAILDTAVCNYTYHTYHAYTVLEKPNDMKMELVSLDKEIKQSYPNAYSLGFNSKLVRYLRKSRFLLYPIICKYFSK